MLQNLSFGFRLTGLFPEIIGMEKFATDCWNRIYYQYPSCRQCTQQCQNTEEVFYKTCP